MASQDSLPVPHDTPSSIAPEEFAALLARVATLEREVALLQAPDADSLGVDRTDPVQVLQPELPPVPQPEHVPPLPPPHVAPPRKVSLEDRVGAQVFSRIGIIALLAGTAWFLKWAIDNQWLGPAERVIAGLLAGAGLVLWSQRFRRRGFLPFSYALNAVGTGALYLSLWAAFHLYHLLPAAAALGAMLLVTAWNAWMAWAQTAELLGAYALVGGLATPSLLSAGGDHEVFLFTYLAGIGLTTVLLVRRRPWPRLLPLPLAATIAYIIGWYTQYFKGPESVQSGQMTVTLVFLAAFFCIFAAASTKQTEPLKSWRNLIVPFYVPIVNAVFIGLALYSVLEDAGYHSLLPWAAVLLAVVYLALTRVRRTSVAHSVHLLLAVVFLTVAIPLKLSGQVLVIAWLAEGTGLLWAAKRVGERASDASASRVLQVLGVLALAFGLVDWFTGPLRSPGFGPPFWNMRFAAAMAGVAALGISAAIARGAASREGRPYWRQTSLACLIALNLTALQAGTIEIVAYWQTGGPRHQLASDLSISGFMMAYGAGLLTVGFLKRSAALRWQALLLLTVTIGKVFVIDIGGLSQGYRVASFLGLGALLLAVSFAYQRDMLGLREDPEQPRAGDG